MRCKACILTFFIYFCPQNQLKRTMKFTIELYKLPFIPDSKQIIYVAGEKDEKVTELIQKHYHRIRDCFQSCGYTFCYVPYVKHDLLTGERLHYNAPFAKSSQEADDMVNDNFILDYMVHPENRDKVTPSLLYYNPNGRKYIYTDDENQLNGVTISENSFTGNYDLKDVLEEILDDIHNNTILFHRYDATVVAEDQQPRFSITTPEEETLSAEDSFDYESKQLIQEIEYRVNKLRQKGIESYLIEKLFSNRKTMLSRMHITRDFRIYLGDYFDTEIVMKPLPKAVYFLFLRHPEGIPFKFLSDYQQELTNIYNRLKPCSEATLRSISAVTDPTNNSINEKCARIREAFVAKFDEHLAEKYFITGKRGEPKGVRLPRELVNWDKEIDDLFKVLCPCSPVHEV